MARQMRFRKRYDFQLNLTKTDEYQIAELIVWLKSGGLFSKTIRDGIRLICDLRAGNLDVLFELFPWVRAEFLEYMASVKPQKTEAEIEIQRQLKQIEELLANARNATPHASGGGGPKKIAVPNIPAPEFDDDTDLLVVSKAKSSGNAAQNFLNSAFNLIQ